MREDPRRLWIRWLQAALLATIAASAAAMLAPDAMGAGMSLLVFQDPQRLHGFGADALRYLAFVHGVLAAVTIGWCAGLLMVLGQGTIAWRARWRVLSLSLLAWFLPGTWVSVSLGVWPNLLLDLAFLLVFAIPLAATVPRADGRQV